MYWIHPIYFLGFFHYRISKLTTILRGKGHTSLNRVTSRAPLIIPR